MALATLSIDLVAKLGELQAGLDKAGQIAAKSAQQIAGEFSALRGVASGIGASLTAAFSAAGLVAFARATVDGLDKLNDLADATGATVEKISALEDIAARTGTSIDTVGDAMLKLNKALGEKQDSDAGRVFKALALDTEALKRADPADALRTVAVAFNGFADNGDKARAIQELFGKSAREVAPLLKALAEAGELNATVTKDQAEQAEKFNKQLGAMAKNSADTARAIASQLLPAVNELLETFNKKGLAAAVGLDEFGNKLGQVSQAYQLLALGLQRLRVQDILKSTPEDRNALLQLEQIDQKARELAGRFNESRAAYLRLGESAAGAGRGFVNPPAARPPLPEDDKADKAGKLKAVRLPEAKLDEATRDALRAINDTDAGKVEELQRTLAKLRELFGDTPTDPAVVQALGNIGKKLEDLDPAARAAAERVKELDKLMEGTTAGQMETLQHQADLLADALGKATDPAQVEKLGQALGGVFERMGELRNGARKTAEEVSEFWRQAASNIQDAFGNTLERALDGNFRSIGELWGNLIKRMLAQAAAAQLNRALFGDDFAKNGQVGGAAKVVWDWIKDQIGGSFGGPRAMGGPVNAGVPYLVGERGPEIVVPRNSGTVIPNGGALASGPPMVFNFHGPMPADQRAMVRSEVLQALQVWQRRSYVNGG